MKKLLLLSALLIFACSSDSGDNDSNIPRDVLIVNGQEYPYPISYGVLQMNMADSANEDYKALIFGQSNLPPMIFCSDGNPEGYIYQGHYINIGYQSNTSDGTGVFTEVLGQYDLYFSHTDLNEENFTFFGDNVSSELSVSKEPSDNLAQFDIYTVELNTVDENGNSVEVYYSGIINTYDCGF